MVLSVDSIPCPSPGARPWLSGGSCLAWSTWDFSPSSPCLFVSAFSTSLVHFRSLGSAQSHSSHRKSHPGREQRKNHRSWMEPSLWWWGQGGHSRTSLMRNTNLGSEVSPALRGAEPVNSQSALPPSPFSSERSWPRLGHPSGGPGTDRAAARSQLGHSPTSLCKQPSLLRKWGIKMTQNLEIKQKQISQQSLKCILHAGN